jgi:multisubunit Na+/H+ antiporter MnhC subunit
VEAFFVVVLAAVVLGVALGAVTASRALLAYTDPGTED